MTAHDDVVQADDAEEHIINHIRQWGTERRTVYVDVVGEPVTTPDDPDPFCFAYGFESRTGWRVLFPLGMEQAENLRQALDTPDAGGRIPVAEVTGVNPKYLCWIDRQPREFDAVDRPPEPAQLTLFQGGQHDIR